MNNTCLPKKKKKKVEVEVKKKKQAIITVTLKLKLRLKKEKERRDKVQHPVHPLKKRLVQRTYSTLMMMMMNFKMDQVSHIVVDPMHLVEARGMHKTTSRFASSTVVFCCISVMAYH